MSSDESCAVEACIRPQFSGGWCKAHYQRVRRTGHPGTAEVLVFSGATECRYEGCDRPHYARGLCTKHKADERRDAKSPDRERRNRSKAGLDRILPHLDATGPCWEWQRSRSPDGYGRLRFLGRYWFTHRLMWELLVGPIPDGLELDHLCRNPPCCNPDHLEPVTHAENLRRGTSFAARFAIRSRCTHGHEYTPENTKIRHRNGSVIRVCITCARAMKRAQYARLKEKNGPA